MRRAVASGAAATATAFMFVVWDTCVRHTIHAGYEFKKGSKGVGYYRTVLPEVTFDPRSNKKQQQKERVAKKEAGPGGYVNGPNGLKYRDMVPGRGAQPKRGQTVKCKYVLRLNGPNGRVVDKSGARPFVSSLVLNRHTPKRTAKNGCACIDCFFSCPDGWLAY